MLEHKVKISYSRTVNINPAVLVFKPRQVSLLSKPPTMNPSKTLILKPDQKVLLLHCIAHYLQRLGFSKTTKKLRLEANIQKHDIEVSSFDLEEVFCKFLEIREHAGKNLESCKIQDLQNGDNPMTDRKGNAAEEIITHDGIPKDKNKEKKKSKKNCNAAGQEQINATMFKEPANNIVEESLDKKLKDKKNKKSSSVNTDDNPAKENAKSEGKKKRKDHAASQNLCTGDSFVLDEGKSNRIDSRKDDLKASKEDVAEKQNKGSKKRKRLASEGDAAQAAGEKAVKESKRRKREDSEESKQNVQSAKSKSLSGTNENNPNPNEESNKIGSSEKLSTNEFDGQTNVVIEKTGGKTVMQKTTKKQWSDSVEPKTVQRFQRIKADEMVFSDERLQDNSYWAKNGAENGYGAKAEEILGQVKGRDFRHEKTKKKRGTYKGGLIDLQSHSIKFNYSDED